jgi:hypothetical protein
VASITLVFAMSPRWNPAEDLRSASGGTYRRLIVTPPALCNAAVITTVILLFVWTIQRRCAWTEPGHWIALWFVWQGVAPYCTTQLFQVVRILSGVRLEDDWTTFYPWSKAVHGLRYLPLAILFVCFALGWKRVANTWPWRVYFACAGVWLLTASLNWMPPLVNNVVHTIVPAFVWPWIYRLSSWQLVILALAIINDLRPSKPRRHWSHWVPALQPLLAYGFSYIPPFVWDFLHPQRVPHSILGP